MAKKNKKNYIGLECVDCKNRNYTQLKSSNMKDKMTINKFCPKCNKHTEHKEGKIK
ncbi:MAG TPA: 50S ribosomal protein L33 [Candidatus Dojkabacteria bacterium]|nr:50S ribosomal protein L33 [Candidatus Dojkabacteria bacterium]HQG57361.1 50S ribosomal protein L33 [Candidatus Dojkabacteria bacterium]